VFKPPLWVVVLLLPSVADAKEPPPETPSPIADEPVGEEVIVVTGTNSETPRQASPVTIEVIDRQRIEESGAQTMTDVLSLRPGLFVERGFSGTGVTMQGLGPQYSLLLVDGVRQIGRTDGVLDLDRFAVEDIDRVEVVRGPSSVLYGSDALGGVINLVTRVPREGVSADALARVDSRLGYEARGRVAYGNGSNAVSLVGSYRAAPAITLGAPRSDETPTTFDELADSHVTAHGIHRRGERWRFDASADYLQRDLRGIDTSGTGATFDRRTLIETMSGNAGARWTGEQTAAQVGVAGNMYRDQFLSDQRMSEALDQYQLTEETLVQVRGQLAHARGRHKLLAGSELMREALASDRLSDPGERVRGAVFVQDELRPTDGDDLIVVPAARLDADSQFGVHATPRIAARWSPREGAAVRGSLGMGYRAPSFKELLLLFENSGVGYVVEGNPDLKPETSYSVQGGAEWQVNRWLWVGGDAYYNRLTDMIFTLSQPDDGSGMLRFSYDNIGRARTYGCESYAVASTGRAALELGYALTRTRDLEAERPLEGVPQHRVTTTVRWRDREEGFEAFLGAVFTGHRPFFRDAEDPLRVTSTDRRVEVRARIAKRFGNGIGGFIGIENALDAGDLELDRARPRTMYAGVEAHR
jgi:outer membrane receptor for ferrienterochelin and colicins